MNQFLKSLESIGISEQNFFEEYWKKKPLFVKNVFKEDELDFVLPEEILGLTQEEDVESRYMSYDRDKQTTQLRRGPIQESSFFETLPKSSWTILIQQLDKLLIEAEDLKSKFNFLPNWMFDDVMVSLASAKGGVGPHVDQYDVFLVQGVGHRLWRYGLTPTSKTEYIKDFDFKILKNFDYSHESIAKTGDVLYLPPGVAHDGVACAADGSFDFKSDENIWCTTFSVGIRAPSLQDVLMSIIPKINKDALVHSVDWQGEPAGELGAKSFKSIQANILGLMKGYLDKSFCANFLTQSLDGASRQPTTDDLVNLKSFIKESTNKETCIRLQPDEHTIYFINEVDQTKAEVYVSGRHCQVLLTNEIKDFLNNRSVQLNKSFVEGENHKFFQDLLNHDLAYMSHSNLSE